MKKLTKLFTVLTAVALMATPVFAQEVEEVEKSGLPENLGISINVALQGKPSSDYLTTSGTHFAPVTNFKPSLSGKIEPSVSYTIPTPLGENFLLKSANVTLSDSVEITPVTVKDSLNVAFTPLPFIVLSTSGQIGTGWDLMGNQGIAVETSTNTYTSKTLPFYKWTVQGTFQFATGALTPNPWANVVMMYSYQLYQEGIFGVNGNYCWQATYGKSNKLAAYQNAIVAYQMPLLSFVRVGAMWENNGYYGSFATNTISPLCQLQFNKHNNLAIVASFQTRGSSEDYGTYDATNKTKTYSATALNGAEFYFDKVALSYTYSF